MNIKGIRIPFVIIVATLVLAALFGIQYVYQQINVDQPLFKLYSQTKAVQKFNIDKKDNITVVNIDLKATDNLQKTYQELFQTTANVIGSNNFKLKIKDNRNKELENAYYDMQFIINEALVRGNFSQMEQVIKEKTNQIGAKSKIFIDDKNIYLQIEKKQNYLYEIIARSNNNLPATSDKLTGGGQNG